MAITNGIKISPRSLTAKAIGIIRKSTGLPISEIKKRADCGEYLIEEDLSDDKSLLMMIRLAEELPAYDVRVELYQGGCERPLEFMKNIYESHRETAREVGLEDR